ncbi:MAG: acyl carrier protein [Bacteroidetes bacterium GWE2_29_8]|nr:MAG: acyl carrier protein [Bacteroidetes bacterium GWE2_29_8]OFY14836.1 MAG: acyl carrier protein [Bacteroidetes bacterium GWF2_29_10]
MERNEIQLIVNGFLVEEFEINENLINPEARLIEDLGISSLDFVDIVVIIEKEFGFKVKREEITQIRTLKDMYVYIENRI